MSPQERLQVDDYESALELIYRRGWTDGLPVVPPTERRVREMLESAGLEPDRVIGVQADRAREITAEAVAVNAVMAGCTPQLFPLVLACVQAVLDPEFHFNHTASVSSPWPLFIVSGPVVRELGLEAGNAVFGGHSRANASVSRAVSLLAWNCLDARPGVWVRAQMGHPGRWASCIAELPDTGWTPLHVQLGFAPDESTVTAFPSQSPLCQFRTQWRVPEHLLDHVCAHLANHDFHWGYHLVVFSPYHQALFLEQGWSKEDVARYIMQNTRATVADLKIRGRWGGRAEFGNVRPEIRPEDHHTLVPLFTPEPERWPMVFDEGSRAKTMGTGLFVITAGGDAGTWMAIVQPYDTSTNPVTRPIKMPRR